MPAFARLVRLLGIQRKHCLACGVAEQKDFIACITPDCKGGGGQWEEGQDPPPCTHTYPTLLAVPPGLYCRECHQTLNNVCSICMGPLSYKDMGDEEM